VTLDKLQVTECPLSQIRDFIEQHHYSKSVRGVTPTHCFRIDHEGQLVGAAIFGIPAMRETIRKYSEDGRLKLVELRRLCFLDEAPRNTESKTIGIMCRILRNKGVQRILSYADLNQGHVGTIYKATGFSLLGQTPSIRVIWYRDRRFPVRNKDQYRKWSTRSINRYQNYQSKSDGLFPYAQEMRAALASGEAVSRIEAGKFIYLKDLHSAVPRLRRWRGKSRDRIVDVIPQEPIAVSELAVTINLQPNHAPGTPLQYIKPGGLIPA